MERGLKMPPLQKDHDAFLRLPKIARQRAYEMVRAKVGGNKPVTVSDMLKAYQFMQS